MAPDGAGLRRVQPLLAEAGYRAIAIDLPGMGDSDLLADGRSYETAYVADLMESAVKAASIERFALVGHDIGTWVSYAWASRHPEGITKLVLSEAAVPGVTSDQIFGIANAPKVFQFYFGAVPELPEMLTEGREAQFFSWLFAGKSRVKGAITEEDTAAYAASYSRDGRMKAGFDFYRAVPNDIEQNRGAPPPPMPILTVGGEGGVGSSLAEAIRALRPDVAGHVMEGVGHYLPEEAPRPFADLVVSFLRD